MMELLPEAFRQAIAALPDGTPSAKWLTKASAQFGAEAAAFAAAQSDLRRRGMTKFPDALRMFFAREALEQASGLEVSRLHASHFPKGAMVADLTTGIGGDLIAIAERGQAIGFEVDPIRLGCAQANLEVLGLSADIRLGDSLEASAESSLTWADPGRRAGSRRLRSMDDYLPSPRRILEKFAGADLIGLKLSPMDADDDLAALIQGDIAKGRIEFVSHRRECKEACLYTGGLIGTTSILRPGHWAVMAGPGASEQSSALAELALDGLPRPESVDRASKWVYEVDPAVVRGHGEGAFSLNRLGTRPGFLTGQALIESPWLRPFDVVFDDALDIRRLRSELKRLGLQPATVKLRASQFDLPAFSKSLGTWEGLPSVVLVYEVGRRLRAAVSADSPASD